jgi:hypothetical protein
MLERTLGAGRGIPSHRRAHKNVTVWRACVPGHGP